MKVIIAGTRYFNNVQLLANTLKELNWNITEVVSGGAKGADALGELWATFHDKPIKRFEANWNKYGRKAGPIRNNQMAEYSDALIAFWDGKSPGTKNMVDLMKKAEKLVAVIQYKKDAKKE